MQEAYHIGYIFNFSFDSNKLRTFGNLKSLTNEMLLCNACLLFFISLNNGCLVTMYLAMSETFIPFFALILTPSTNKGVLQGSKNF